MAGGQRAEAGAIDVQVMVVKVLGWSGGDPLADGDGGEASEPGSRDGVDDERAAGLEDAAGLADCRGQVGDVLEDLAGHDHICHLVGERQPHDVAAGGSDAVVASLGERGHREVETDVVVALAGDMRGQQPGAAGKVEQHRTLAGGLGHEPGAGLGDPVQHREPATRLPPLVGEVVVLPRVVSWESAHVPSLPLLVRACHPEPTAAVTGLAAILAWAAGADPVLVGLVFLSGQLSIGWSNDWVDAARDRLVGRADKPTVRGLSVSALRMAALLAAAACVPLSLLLGWRAGLVHLAAVASGWAYNLRLKATAVSFLPYALSFGLVPSVISLAAPGQGFAPWWATAAGALLGVGAHGANVLPDLDDDVATGVVGLPHRLGRGLTSLLSGLALVLATVALAVGPGLSLVGGLAVGLSVLVFGVGLLLGRRSGSRAPFLSVIVVALVDVALLVLQGADLTAG